jgi:regulator of cell morphogenesis and NO signaling
MTTNPDATLAQIAVDRPEAAGVFARYRLDFCCHAQRPLGEACTEKGIDPRTVIDDLDRAQSVKPDAASWKDRPLDELVDFILTRYHAPLRQEVAGLVELAQKVERVHAEKPTCPRGLASHLTEVQDALESHLGKEERILFPMIRSGRGALAFMPVKMMMMEHEDHGESLRRTRELTADLVAPPEACRSWRSLYSELHRLETELMEHIHLENNILFPRALNGDATLDDEGAARQIE